jgi:photosystem II stability/assembly factor-like uncharacterized protein
LDLFTETRISFHPAKKGFAAAATDQGVLVSFDSGKSWRKQSSFSFNEISFDHQDDQVLYDQANTRLGESLSKSTDQGMSWNELFKTDPGISAWISNVSVDPQNRNYLFIGTGEEAEDGSTYGAVLQSKDGGKTWSKLSNIQGAVGSIQFDGNTPPNLYALVYDSNTSNSHLYRSRNTGKTWQLLNQFPSSAQAIQIDPLHVNGLIAYGYPNLVFVSNDQGMTWSQITLPTLPFPGAIQGSLWNANKFYGSTQRGAYTLAISP